VNHCAGPNAYTILVLPTSRNLVGYSGNPQPAASIIHA
jgi:hypothetical protein